MTLFLRTKENETVVDIELNNGENGLDVRVATDIKIYSEILLANLDKQEQVIEDFSEIDNLRGWFFEVYMEQTEKPDLPDVQTEIKKIILPIAEKYNLFYVID